jgi:hypothetical protein
MQWKRRPQLNLLWKLLWQSKGTWGAANCGTSGAGDCASGAIRAGRQ